MNLISYLLSFLALIYISCTHHLSQSGVCSSWENTPLKNWSLGHYLHVLCKSNFKKSFMEILVSQLMIKRLLEISCSCWHWWIVPNYTQMTVIRVTEHETRLDLLWKKISSRARRHSLILYVEASIVRECITSVYMVEGGPSRDTPGWDPPLRPWALRFSDSCEYVLCKGMCLWLKKSIYKCQSFPDPFFFLHLICHRWFDSFPLLLL